MLRSRTLQLQPSYLLEQLIEHDNKKVKNQQQMLLARRETVVNPVIKSAFRRKPHSNYSSGKVWCIATLRKHVVIKEELNNQI